MSTLLTILLGVIALGLTLLVTCREFKRWKTKREESIQREIEDELLDCEEKE